GGAGGSATGGHGGGTRGSGGTGGHANGDHGASPSGTAAGGAAAASTSRTSGAAADGPHRSGPTVGFTTPRTAIAPVVGGVLPSYSYAIWPYARLAPFFSGSSLRYFDP